jgi:hypothetical protein
MRDDVFLSTNSTQRDHHLTSCIAKSKEQSKEGKKIYISNFILFEEDKSDIYLRREN